MFIYLIERHKYLSSVLSGLGAARHGGRWNFKDTPAIYASESRSLAMLEILVHTRTTALVPHDKVIVSIEIPSQEFCYTITTEDLPPHWDAVPQPSPRLSRLFHKHCIQGGYGGLKVPSVVMPEEYNYVLNPQHSDFTQLVSISSLNPLHWDKRLS